MPYWYYKSRPYNLACHDLTTYLPPPPNLGTLLGLGLKFCPIPKYTSGDSSTTIRRFTRDIYIRDIFAGEMPQPHFNPKLYTPSKWEPQQQDVSPITRTRTDMFTSSLLPLFKKRRGRQNLLPHQKHLLSLLQHQTQLMIIQCDKNLGPAVIERQAYIKLVFRDHLSDSSTYRYLDRKGANNFIHRIAHLLRQFIKKHRTSLGKSVNQIVFSLSVV